MQYLPFVLLALACPLGMILMMRFMDRGMMGMGNGHDAHEATAELPSDLPTDPEKRLAVLQAQRQLLDAQIAAMGDGVRAPASRVEKEAQ